MTSAPEHTTEPTATREFVRPQVTLRWGSATHVGKIRRLNEDSFMSAPGVFIVADGMGGHAAGDVASRLVIEAFSEIATGEALPLAVIAETINDANDRVRRHAAEQGHDGMGSTLVGALLIDNAGEDSLVVFNVGDARCYALVEDRLTQLTIDHSLVQEMVEQGELGAGEARRHPQRNVVTRAIGIESSVSADFVVVPGEERTVLLLCSDGVHGELDDDQIATILRDHPDPARAAAALIDAVLLGRAADNATAMVVDIVRSADLDAAPGTEFESTGPRWAPAVLEITAPRPQRSATPSPVSTTEPDLGADDARRSLVPHPTPDSGTPFPPPTAPGINTRVLIAAPEQPAVTDASSPAANPTLIDEVPL